jgi:hypothetical protein
LNIFKGEIVDEPLHKNLKVGDLITAYHKGYHIVEELCIDRCYGLNGSTYQNPVVKYRQVLTDAGKPINSKLKACHISHCNKVTVKVVHDEFANDIKIVKDKMSNLLAILKDRFETQGANIWD